ncbi:MAG: helix-turn-helix domain-containing protein [Caldisphaera sp.]
MLRPKEVCQRLGTSYRTLKEYVKKGYIKRVWVGVIPLKGQRRVSKVCLVTLVKPKG